MRSTRRARAPLFLLASVVALVGCDVDGDGVTLRHDCDDRDPNRFPGNTEVCDEIDNDCDFEIDERLTRTYYMDTDGDGVGTGSTARACAPPVGFVEPTGDCDDTNATVRPGAAETCDGLDNDCDGFVDVDGNFAIFYYPDVDGDGHGDARSTEIACADPGGWSSSRDDCDDGAAEISPAGTEVCNGLDDDCNGAVDDIEGGC